MRSLQIELNTMQQIRVGLGNRQQWPDPYYVLLILKHSLHRPPKKPHKHTYHEKPFQIYVITPETLFPGSIIASEAYEPLTSDLTYHPPILLPSTVPIVGLGAACISICGYYHILQRRLGVMNDSTRDRKKLRWIDKHMVLSLDNWRAGRWWTLITSTVTHYSPTHLAVNMATLFSCGPDILLLFGLPTFVMLWILGGVAGGATQLYIDQRSRQKGIIRKGLGASACLCAMEAVLTCANPNAIISMSGLYLPQWLGTAAFAGWSVAALTQGWEPGIGHEAHLGGLAAGVIAWFGALRWFTPSLGPGVDLYSPFIL